VRLGPLLGALPRPLQAAQLAAQLRVLRALLVERLRAPPLGLQQQLLIIEAPWISAALAVAGKGVAQRLDNAAG
jgi:hypothetical protein